MDFWRKTPWNFPLLQFYVDKNAHCLPMVPAGHALDDMVLCPTVEQTSGGNAAH